MAQTHWEIDMVLSTPTDSLRMEVPLLRSVGELLLLTLCEGDAMTSGIEQDVTKRDDILRTGYRRDCISIGTRLLGMLGNATTASEFTVGSKEISAMPVRLHQFQTDALNSDGELCAMILP